jgi:choline-sulfatase
MVQADESAAPQSVDSRATLREADRASQGPFLTAAAVLFVPLVAFAALDAFGSTASLGSRRLSSWALLFAYVSPLFLLLGAATAGAWALLARLRARAAAAGLRVIDPADRACAWAATVPVAVAACLLVFALTYISATAFENHRLAALLCAFATLIALAPLYGLWLASYVVLQSLARRVAVRPWGSLAVVLAPAIPAAVVLAVLVQRNTSGLETMSAWLWGGPAFALAALVVTLSIGRRFRRELLTRARLPLLLALPIATACAQLAALKARDLPEIAVLGSLWSGKLVAAARVLSDFDRDGASSLFGEADCAPFDRKTGPLAVDVPGDGIDNNCFGGDAKPESGQQPPPAWFDDAPGRAAGLNLLVITIEAFRADHASFLGYARATTPVISELARQSQVFARAYSGSNATIMSMLSLWAARTPSQVKRGRASGAPVWVPELLQSQGFRTGASLVEWKRFDTLRRGFDHFDATTPQPTVGGFKGFPDGKLIDGTIDFIDKNRGGKFMAWTHLVGPHYVYERAPGAPNFGDEPADLYDSELWEADRQVGRLLAYLKQHALLERTIIIISGDHGESLGEHGVATHHETLFDAEMHTMSLLYVPGVEHHVVPQPVVLRDVLTTAMNVLGVRAGFSELRGRNLVPALRGQPLVDDTLFLEMATYDGQPRKIAALRWPFKLHYDVKSRRKALYNLVDDPRELRRLEATHPAEVADLSLRIARHLEAPSP